MLAASIAKMKKKVAEASRLTALARKAFDQLRSKRANMRSAAV